MRPRLHHAPLTTHSCDSEQSAGRDFDTLAIHLDAPVGEEELVAVPVAGDIGELLAEILVDRIRRGRTKSRQPGADVSDASKPVHFLAASRSLILQGLMDGATHQ